MTNNVHFFVFDVFDVYMSHRTSGVAVNVRYRLWFFITFIKIKID